MGKHKGEVPMKMQQVATSNVVPSPVVNATLSELNNPTTAVELRLHRLMNQALEAPEPVRKRAWLIVLRAYLLAYDNDELSDLARNRFLRVCPKEYKDVHFRFLSETGMLAKPKRGMPSPLGNETKPSAERTKRAAALAARRAERNANRPVGRHESAADPHGKGKKKNAKKK